MTIAFGFLATMHFLIYMTAIYGALLLGCSMEEAGGSSAPTPLPERLTRQDDRASPRVILSLPQECSPQYPRIARFLSHEGAVKLVFGVDETGVVTDAYVFKSSQSRWLDAAAADAVSACKFPAPAARKIGRKKMIVQIEFTLDR